MHLLPFVNMSSAKKAQLAVKAHRAATRQATVFEIILRKNKTIAMFKQLNSDFFFVRSFIWHINCDFHQLWVWTECDPEVTRLHKRAPRVTWACRHALYTGVNMEPSRLGLCWTNKVSLQLKSASVESKNWKKNINKKGARFFAKAVRRRVVGRWC